MSAEVFSTYRNLRKGTDTTVQAYEPFSVRRWKKDREHSPPPRNSDGVFAGERQLISTIVVASYRKRKAQVGGALTFRRRPATLQREGVSKMREGQAKEEPEEVRMSEEELRDQKLVGRELRRLRETLGLTPMELAARMGPSYTGKFVAQFESGDIPMEVGAFFAMIRVLQPDLNELLPKRLMARRITEEVMEMDEESRNALGVIIGKFRSARREAE